ncbi:hypothetical protein GCM10012284_48570 [Mangrovihabitans endophyticus]|uniref:Uncharacterized protein n=2 Tax=Mangrovihabitans endophyticus TaxID=1751298 RepID=A0A8J3C352_9ACTN|nr:hypothetical protein GCM10012284_48570 [Mangrovihabitans endophyticus]
MEVMANARRRRTLTVIEMSVAALLLAFLAGLLVFGSDDSEGPRRRAPSSGVPPSGTAPTGAVTSVTYTPSRED